MHVKAESIKNKEDIEKIKAYFLDQSVKYDRFLEWDKQLLFFVLGINTCYTTDELLHLKWIDIFDYDTNDIKEYIVYEKYKFYLNNSCREVLYNFIDKYNRHNHDIYVFTSRSNSSKPVTSEAINRVYRKIQDELYLSFNFSTMSLRKTFAYWQIYYCKRDYVKMSKLKDLLHTLTIGNDINIFANYDIHNDMVYINDINL